MPTCKNCAVSPYHANVKHTHHTRNCHFPPTTPAKFCQTCYNKGRMRNCYTHNTKKCRSESTRSCYFPTTKFCQICCDNNRMSNYYTHNTENCSVKQSKQHAFRHTKCMYCLSNKYYAKNAYTHTDVTCHMKY